MSSHLQNEQDNSGRKAGDADSADLEANSEPSSASNNAVYLGGRSEDAAFCLLDGFFHDPETGETSRVTIPITALPATLGRSHETDGDDKCFFGLGKKRALSRKQCRIDYRDSKGGIVRWSEESGQLIYANPSTEGATSLAPLNVDHKDLPPNGFFVIECLGKNRILVNQDRVEQGHGAVLTSGSALRISSYTFYFLLPTDSQNKEQVVVETLSPPKRRKIPDDTPTLSGSLPKKTKSNQEDLESLPVERLLEIMSEATEMNQWERRHQLIGATIALHAVRDAARDPKIQSVATASGVSRSEIMTWIEESPKYSEWVQQMLTKMESRSYQAAITKCLLKAGFTRTGSSGRYIKWHLPEDILITVKKRRSSETKDISEPDEKNEEIGGEEEKTNDQDGDAPKNITSRQEGLQSGMGSADFDIDE